MKEKASKKSAYEKLQEMSKELHVMGSIGALVGWDQVRKSLDKPRTGNLARV